MLQKIKTSFLQILALSPLATFGFTGVVAAQSSDVDPQGAICQGANTLQVSSDTGPADSTCANSGDDPSERVNNLIRQIINIFSVIVGIVAVIMIIYGGLKYITSGGDSGRLTSAKHTILYAFIGLIIVALAQFFVRFVLTKVNEVST